MCLVQHIASCSTLLTGWMPTIFRAGRGMTLWEKARPDPPSKKLELFSYENNPVRNKICFSYNNFTFHMIGLPHIYRFSMHEVIVQDTTSTMFFSCTYSFSYAMHNHFPLFPLHYSQYARIVREALCELELPYILQNVGDGSSRTKLLVDITGSKEVCSR